MTPAGKRRSAFADRLREHADFAWGDDAIFARRGTWRDYFRQRIGSDFDGRIVFEIGCFEASTLAAIAAKYPKSGFIGLDWKAKAIYLGAERIAASNLKNVALLRGRAEELSRIFADGEVGEILIFHPDPFDQPDELPNRLMAEPFLLDAHRALRDRGTISLKTDHAGYYQWTLALFGIPEPNWSEKDRSTRIGLRDLVTRERLPVVSDKARACFEVTSLSRDFWNDLIARNHTAKRCFADEVTHFEDRFIKKRQPIFYFEMTKR